MSEQFILIHDTRSRLAPITTLTLVVIYIYYNQLLVASLLDCVEYFKENVHFFSTLLTLN
ncbi:hypothetical protein PCURB6_42080 [Paenibacillus curdlanolyticus]|nr:hypothetical protein PCURB6_42080 [Paenibacillus curdlanolyticus]